MTQVDKSEKITINIGLIDLGQIDLLVNEGFYAHFVAPYKDAQFVGL